MIDSHNNLWIGTFSKGLVFYSSDKTKVKLPFTVNDIRSIQEDEQGNIWVATNGNGFLSYDPLKKTYVKYSHQPGINNSLSNNNIMSMAIQDHQIYLATFGGGLSIFDKITKEFKNIRFNGDKNLGILDNNVISVYVNRNDDIWIGGPSGISHLNGDLSKPVITNYAFQELAFDRNLAGLIVDDDNQVWISTDAGIYKFQPEDSLFIKVNLGYQLNNSEFHLNAILKTGDNRLFFGAEDGGFAFDPMKVFDNSIPSEVYITDILVNGKPRSRLNAQSYMECNAREGKLSFSASENMLTIEYSALQLPNASGIDYLIKMENIDEEWRPVGRNRIATYSNIAPGNYTFKVQSTDIRGNWNSNVAEFDFEIAYPLWLRWWAIGIYLIIIWLVSSSVLKYTRRLAELKNNLKLEKLSREKEEEIHRLKLSFFTNISHDLRTPLTLIGGQRIIKLILLPDLTSLEEVVIIGYGTTHKRDITGAVAKIDDKEFHQGHVTNAEQLIANKIPGVQVIPTSGRPGAGSSFLIRGGASLNASNDPLVVIDGVPVEGDSEGSDYNWTAKLFLTPPDDAKYRLVFEFQTATYSVGKE